jgi:hypothetical protein
LEASGQLHALTALPPGKERPVPIGEEVGWASEPVWTIWRREFWREIQKSIRQLGRPRYRWEDDIKLDV